MDGNDDHSDLCLSDPDFVSVYTWKDFPEEVSWSPEKLEVNGRNGKRAICVLAQDRFHYRVYDLDSSSSDQEGQAVGTKGSDELVP